MPTKPDPLWTPGAPGDADVARLESLLSRYRHSEAMPVPTPGPVASRRPRTALRWAAACVLLLGMAVSAWIPWRLQWAEDTPWTIAGLQRDALPVGGQLVTAPGEHRRVDVARIGVMDLSPGSRVTLLETRSGRHRVALESGHVKARIWAPPGYFGVRVGAAEVVDLGCVFEMWKHGDGQGRILVSSGWIMHTVADVETLVPAGFELHFDDWRAGIPLRPGAAEAFASAATRVDAAESASERDRDAEAQAASLATDGDAYTLLSLLTRHPGLADGPLYPRLAELLGVPANDARHRHAWATGQAPAINAWWRHMPQPPKQWWRNWRDAVPKRGRRQSGGS